MSRNLIAALVILAIITLITGCSTASIGSVSSSGCPSVYDGTWKGVISTSGSLDVWRTVDGESVQTKNPFTAQYNFEMTIKCFEGSGNHLNFQVTHLKASHPLFNCVDGCEPLSSEWGTDFASWFDLNKETGSSMMIIFKNKATIDAFVTPGRISFSEDGKKMMLTIAAKQGGGGHSIGGLYDESTATFTDIETDNCRKMANDACSVDYINPNTIFLEKVS